MQFLNNRSIVLVCIFGGALSLLAGYYSSNGILLFICSFLFFLSLLIWKFGYILAPLLTKSLNISLRDRDFVLCPSQDVIIKKVSDGFIASSFISIQLRDSTSFKSETQKVALMEMFERAISSIRFTLKLCFVVCNVDLSEHIQTLEEHRSIAEHKLSQSKNSASRAQLEREISYFNSQLERLTLGDSPMQVLAYAQTTVFALSKEQAVSRVQSQAKEACGILSNSLGANTTVLSGEDLLHCVGWESFSPTSKTQIRDSIF